MGDALYVSGEYCVTSLDFLTTQAITHVVSVFTEQIPANVCGKLTVLHIPVRDEGDYPIIERFLEISAFIDRAASIGGKVLVHCSAGMSRSATCVIAHVMLKKNLSAQNAFHFVRQRRPLVQPNVGFIKQLLSFERDVLPELLEPSQYFLAEYVMEVVLGTEQCQKLAISPEAFQHALDECDDNIMEALLQFM